MYKERMVHKNDMTALEQQIDTFLPSLDLRKASQFSKLSRHLVLDESNASNENLGVEYLCGSDESDDYDEEYTAEAYLARFGQGLQQLDLRNLINITNLAFWKASSQKDGNPISHALDDNAQNFWQSDGAQPHSIEASFSKRVEIVQLAFFLSLAIDESYTPQILKVYAGHSSSDSTLYKTLDVRNVNGWVVLTFADNRPQDKLLKCQYLRIDIPVNHENGKDTHLRGIRVYTPYLRTPIDGSRLLETFSLGHVLSEGTIR
ncbi:LANO_0D00848g1_1 [Lachancea nothofagi CBS 11611]|uniref:LANO_0D00848g1_1 n=1 Tax=Lachancea nothofagi CBS 11611 TaxID=1266666 RepID=A0A1G4JD06_9SACH|nr:LANO_0D00848g1_1 [Lachancea nothofagi CBS 11611]